MKEIFDWLREQIEKYTYGVEIRNVDGRCDIVFSLTAKDIINEAEAKWKSEVCEWKPHDKAKNVLIVHGELHYRHYVSEWKFCPYCGKRIKIVEVE